MINYVGGKVVPRSAKCISLLKNVDLVKVVFSKQIPSASLALQKKPVL